MLGTARGGAFEREGDACPFARPGQNVKHMSGELLLRPTFICFYLAGILFPLPPLSVQAQGSRWNSLANPAHIKEIADHLPPRPAGFGRPISDRQAWDKLAENPSFASVVTHARELVREPVPALPDELYLDYSKTGNRDRCQKVMHARSTRLVTLTLAECTENQGHFLAPLVDTISAICQERTWVYAAHDGRLENFHGRTVEDLRATALGWELASAGYLLGDKLPPVSRQLLHENIERRVLQPFRDMVSGRRREIYWLRATHNWNAVCLAGVTGAALALEGSPADRAQFVAAAEHYIQFFLSGFTRDGYCSEGVGYWNYGFGHFLMLSEVLRQATGGWMDLLADPVATAPALFCTRAEILNGIYPTIADCAPGSRPDPRFMQLIEERLGLGNPGGSAADFAKPAGSLTFTMLFSFLKRPLAILPHAQLAVDSPLRTWFPNGGVLICRPAPGFTAPFAVALKGGNNAEHHNHNDLGSFSVVAGKAMVICDPGSEVYTARTFSARRYESKVLSSYGHAVPVMAGRLQRSGAGAKAVVLRADFARTQDTLVLDLKSAYEVPELRRLERIFKFRRTASPALTVRDEVDFGEPETFETALITWGNWKRVSDQELLVADEMGAVKVQIDTGGAAFNLRWEKLDEDVPSKKKPMRLCISLASPVKSATVSLTIQPQL